MKEDCTEWKMYVVANSRKAAHVRSTREFHELYRALGSFGGDEKALIYCVTSSGAETEFWGSPIRKA